MNKRAASSEGPPPGGAPSVAVLLAVYNGMPYLPEQVESILDQQGVTVRILVSDDGSTDGSVDWLQARADAGAPIELLPRIAPSGSSAANFRRLILDAVVGEHELVAFADQDDRWLPGKLERHAALIAGGAEFVSSNVMAFDESGAQNLVKKDWPQRRWDFLTEGPGPGCSFLLSAAAFDVVRRATAAIPEAARTDFHDSMVYAIGRAAGLPWVIDGVVSLDYRQHADNVLGSNHGGRAAATRLRMIRERWHREQAVLHARIAIAVAEEIAPGPHAIDPDAMRMILTLLEDGGPSSRIRLARGADQLRRRPRDRRILGGLILSGLW